MSQVLDLLAFEGHGVGAARVDLHAGQRLVELGEDVGAGADGHDGRGGPAGEAPRELLDRRLAGEEEGGLDAVDREGAGGVSDLLGGDEPVVVIDQDAQEGRVGPIPAAVLQQGVMGGAAGGGLGHLGGRIPPRAADPVRVWRRPVRIEYS